MHVNDIVCALGIQLTHGIVFVKTSRERHLYLGKSEKLNMRAWGCGIYIFCHAHMTFNTH